MSRLSTHGMDFPDIDANEHFAGGTYRVGLIPGTYDMYHARMYVGVFFSVLSYFPRLFSFANTRY